MKFIDEAVITVEAGKGGDGCLSFRREKFVPMGGPNGGDGGDGGSIYLQADSGINTLVDFRFKRTFNAPAGQKGMGSDCTGRSGDDVIVRVPVGTEVYDVATEELLGDLLIEGTQLLVAQGGFHGLGNARFKSSVNRSPRETTKGSAGDLRQLRLSMKVLADVGLLGLPNAGKSTFIRAVSAATPKVADYPFTTLHPQLGVVRVDESRSFVIADVPGLIEGAADGAGLGIRFLKHLERTRVLLHIIDVAPLDGGDPVVAAQTIINEIGKYKIELAAKPRWLILNKLDLLAPAEAETRCQAILEALAWTRPVFKVSALNKQGTQAICYQLMDFISQIDSQATNVAE